MTLRNLKLFIGISILLVYIGIGVFGLFEMTHMANKPMMDCPYAQNGSALCKNSLDHINDWKEFSNVTFSPLLVLTLLVFGIILYFLNEHNFLNQKQYFYKWKYYIDNKKYVYKQEIIKWLSLFENSPSLYTNA